MNPKVDAYINRAKAWRAETEKLRAIALASGLTEDLKWGKPCYTFEAGNIAIIQGFKESIAFMFFKGALLTDPKKLLEKPGENSNSARRIRFTDVAGIAAIESKLKAFIKEAVKLEQTGAEVEVEPQATPYPVEFQSRLDHDPKLKAAFEALTPGRQRGYLMHFNQAKQSATRTARVEKAAPRILDGLGLNEFNPPGTPKKPSTPRYSSIEDYLSKQDAPKAKTIKAVLGCILKEFPELEGKIAWNVPHLHRDVKYVVGIDAFTHHITFSAWSPKVIKDFKPRLEPYVVFKNCFQIPVDWKPDKKLLKDLVNARLAELE